MPDCKTDFGLCKAYLRLYKGRGINSIYAQLFCTWIHMYSFIVQYVSIVEWIVVSYSFYMNLYKTDVLCFEIHLWTELQTDYTFTLKRKTVNSFSIKNQQYLGEAPSTYRIYISRPFSTQGSSRTSSPACLHCHSLRKVVRKDPVSPRIGYTLISPTTLVY